MGIWSDNHSNAPLDEDELAAASREYARSVLGDAYLVAGGAGHREQFLAVALRLGMTHEDFDAWAANKKLR